MHTGRVEPSCLVRSRRTRPAGNHRVEVGERDTRTDTLEERAPGEVFSGDDRWHGSDSIGIYWPVAISDSDIWNGVLLTTPRMKEDIR